MLLTALIGPYFIDWTAYRHAFEEQGERLFGHRVKVLGTADARLFPVPSLTFTDVRIGDVESPLMTVSRFEVDIELTPLIKGEVRVLDMRLDEPDLDLTLDETGRLSWFLPQDGSGRRLPLDPAQFSIGTLSVQSGRIRVDDLASGQQYAFDDVGFSLEARSLFGPYKIDGSAVFDGMPLSLQAGTGIYREGEGLQVKLRATPASLPMSLALDGVMTSQTGRLTYEGTMVAERVLADEEETNPVRAEGRFLLDAEAFRASELDIAIGSEDRSLRLEGEGAVTLGDAPRFEADLIARQIDLDRALGQGPSDPLSIPEAFEHIVALIKASPRSGVPGRLSMKIPGIVVAGGLIENVAIKAGTRADGWAIDSISATLPGRTGFAAEGLLGLTSATSFSGRVLMRAPQPSALIGWLDPENAKIGRLDPFEIDTNFQARAGSVEVDTFFSKVGDSTISGSASWFSNGPDKPSSLSVTATADSLDLDQYLDTPGTANLIARYTAPVADLDSLIKVSAGKIRIASVDIEGVDVNAAFADGALIVDRFFVEDLGGTEVDASGTVKDALTTPAGAFDLSVFATDITGLTRVLDAIVPESPIVEALQRRRSMLAPLALTGRLEARARRGGTEADLTLKGDVGRTSLDHRLAFAGRVDRWRDAEIDIDVTAGNQDGTQLLRQLGFDVLPLAAADDGRVAVKLAGTAAGGLKGRAEIQTGLAGADFEGTVTLAEGKALNLDGTISGRTGDLASSLLLVGRMVPILAGKIPVDLSAVVSGQVDRLTLRKVSGRFGGGPLAGDLVYDASKEVPRLTGSLDLTIVDMRFLSELALGADAWSAIDGSPTADWPSAAFGPPLLGGLDLDIALETDRLIWSEAHPVTGAGMTLRLRDTNLSVDGLKGNVLGGKVSGAIAIARTAGEAVVSGRMRMDNVLIEEIVWKRDGRPVAGGTLDLAFDFEGSGRSIASVVSGLSGGGTMALRKGTLRSMNTGAFDAVVRAADAGLELDDAKVQSVFVGHLDSGALDFDEISGSFAIASGIARARNVVLSTPSATAFGGASVDLGRWTVESDWSIKVDPGAKAVAGADPEVGLVFAGPLDAPARKLDTAPLLAYLTLRAFEQEVQRVEALQAEILERDRLIRELKQRRVEIAALAAERERQAAEEAAREEAERLAPPVADDTTVPDADRPDGTGDAADSPAPPANDGRRAGRAAGSFADRIRRTLGDPNALGGRPLLLSPLPPPVDIDSVPGG